MDEGIDNELTDPTLTGVLGIEQLQIVLLTTNLFSL